MMSRKIILAAACAALAFPAFGGGHGGAPAEVKARQAHMQLYSFNLGLLGDMAKGNVDYDAGAAQAAADNLAAVTSLDQSRYWAPGTDNASIEGTRALPAIWEKVPDVVKISQDLTAAAQGLAEVAGNGQEALGPALGPVGNACSACHKAYRQPSN